MGDGLEILGIWMVVCLGVAVTVYLAHRHKGKVISDPGSVYTVLAEKHGLARLRKR